MSRSKPVVHVVEDSNDDFIAFERACKRQHLDVTLVRFSNADAAREAIWALAGSPDLWPTLILLDLNLPGTNGRDFLTELKGHDELRRIPVVIYSTSSDPSDVRFSFEHHANAYHTKPVAFSQMQLELRDMIHYWTQRVARE